MKISKIIFSALVLSCVVFAGVASAQVMSTPTTVINGVTYGTMPILYNANGDAVNTNGISLFTGTYYLDKNGNHPVSYTSGVYYDPATNTYGGCECNPTGAAGTFVMTGSSPGGGVGIPNTGFGGNAAVSWTILGIAGLCAVAGMAYLARVRNA